MVNDTNGIRRPLNPNGGTVVLSIWFNPEGAYGDFTYFCEEVDARGRVEFTHFAGSTSEEGALALAEKYAAKGADVSMVMEDDSERVW